MPTQTTSNTTINQSNQITKPYIADNKAQFTFTSRADTYSPHTLYSPHELYQVGKYPGYRPTMAGIVKY